MKSPHDSDTVELEPALSMASGSMDVKSVDVRVELAGLSHRGKVRINNEDSFVIARAERVLHTLATNLPQDDVPRVAAEVAYGLVVADGMGGHAAGEVASRVALSSLVGEILQTPDWIMRADDQQTPRIEGRIADHYDHANQAVSAEAEANPRLAGMGTTMTAAFSFGTTLFLGHVGDSRVYLLRGGKLHHLTRDHSFAQALVDSGVIQPHQAKGRNVKNILLRYLGTGGGHIATDVRHLPLVAGDQILLCTDGLTDMVDDEAIASVLAIAATADTACQALVDAALEAGGKDNITVALARYHW
jgi:PPM family protein phosphatase